MEGKHTIDGSWDGTGKIILVKIKDYETCGVTNRGRDIASDPIL